MKGSPFKQMNTTANDKIYKGEMLDEVTVTAKKGELARAAEFVDDFATKKMAKVKKAAKGFNLDKSANKAVRSVGSRRAVGAALGRLAPFLALTGDKRIKEPNYVAPPFKSKNK